MAGKVETKAEMIRAGYKFLNAGKCKSCHAAIEWWLTTNGKKIPFNPMPPSDSSTVKPHWATCPNADDHRAPKQTKAAPAASKQTTGDLLQRLVCELRDKFDAKAVVVVLEDCSASSWRRGLNGEDVRQDLITEANRVRTSIVEAKR